MEGKLIKLSYYEIYNSFDPPPSNPSHSGYEYRFIIELKLVIDVEFSSINTDGENNRTTLLLTYPIKPSNIASTVGTINSQLVTSSANFGQYPEDSYYQSTHFSGQNINGCKKVGYHYTCRAWNDIIINGNISTGSGYSVEFIAGNEIVVLPPSVITPQAILRIDPFLNYSIPMYKATLGEVVSYCGSVDIPSVYKGNTPKNAIDGADNIINPVVDEEKELNPKIDFNLYPNPTNTDMVTLQLTRDSDMDSPIEITMHDISGRLIQVQSQSAGAGMYTMDVSRIAPGTYFVTGSTFGNKVTKRLIVQ